MHERPNRWPCACAARAGPCLRALVSGVLGNHHYVRGLGRGGHRERDFPRHGRRVGDVGRLRVGSLVGVLLQSAGVPLRESGHVRVPCHVPYHVPFRGHPGLGVPGRGESSARGPLSLSCHGPDLSPYPCLFPCPHDHLVRGRDGLGERSDASRHDDDDENAL